MSKKLTTFNLTLITVGSVDIIRNLPAAALIGNDLFLYCALAFFFFLLPCAIVSSWFSKQSTEGIYGWVKQSLGRHVAFSAIWFQWLQNILIYPTFFSFLAAALLYCIDPHLVDNKVLLFLIINIFIWSLTWVNLKGIHFSNKLNSFCAPAGFVIPFILILAIGLIWYLSHPNAWPLETKNDQNSWTSLTAIIISFCGIELAAVHIQDSDSHAYVKALVISVIIIFFTMLFGALTLAMIIPAERLNFISSIPEIIQLFFSQIHMDKLAILMNALIVIGCTGCANNWLLAPIKGLLFASNDYLEEKTLPDYKSSEKILLIFQAACVSVISTFYLLFPSINTSYWLMLTLSTQVYLLMYLLMFIAAIKRAHFTQHNARGWISIVSCLGLFGVVVALIVSFAPPATLSVASKFQYNFLLGSCLMLAILIPSLSKKHLTSMILMAQGKMKVGEIPDIFEPAQDTACREIGEY